MSLSPFDPGERDSRDKVLLREEEEDQARGLSGGWKLEVGGWTFFRLLSDQNRLSALFAGHQRGDEFDQFGDVCLDSLPDQFHPDLRVFVDKAIAH